MACCQRVIRQCNYTIHGRHDVLDELCQRCEFSRLEEILDGDDMVVIAPAVDEPTYTDLELKLPYPIPESIRTLERFWRTTNAELTTSGRHMYGEPTCGTIYKIWECINTYVKPQPADVLLDWGMGAGKMLISKSLFSTVPTMSAVGVEVDTDTFAIAQRNISRQGIAMINA
jgi:hypothetical protein